MKMCETCWWASINTSHLSHVEYVARRRDHLANRIAEIQRSEGRIDPRLTWDYKDMSKHLDDINEEVSRGL